MGRIIGYFIDPEESIAELIYSKEDSKISQSIIQAVMMTIIVGLLTIINYRMMGIKITDIELIQNDTVRGILALEQMNEGLSWICIAGIQIVETLFIVGIRVLIWIALLLIVKCIFRYSVSAKEIILVTIVSQVTWIAIQLLLVVMEIICLVIQAQHVYSVIASILSIFSYWYLILIAIGISISCKTSWLRGGATAFILQAGLWAVATAFPILQVFIG